MSHPPKARRVKRKRSFSEADGRSSDSHRRAPLDEPDSVESEEPRPVSTRSSSSMFDRTNFKRGLLGVAWADPGLTSQASDSSMDYPMAFGPEPKRPVCCVCGEAFEGDGVLLKCRHVSCSHCLIKDTETAELQPPDRYHCPECGTHQTTAPNQRLDKGPSDLILKLKQEFIHKFSVTCEGNGGERKPLRHIYSSLSVNLGKGVIPDEDYRRLMFAMNKQDSQEEEVNLIGLFVKSSDFKMVLTNGVAGIGKSFYVQKFIVDWAEDICNEDVDFVFNLSFREMNLMQEDMSLLQLLAMLHPAVRNLKPQNLDLSSVILILDGLDESRFLLDFNDKQKVSSVTEAVSVSRLLVNLIQGNLLPKAQLWITSRPAASHQIPGELIHKVTEIQGFNDQQKEEYFKKRFSNKPDVAQMVLSHIQSSPTLDMLCQIPIFSWMSSILLEAVFGGEEQMEAPQTLTEMMGAFLSLQTKRSSRKYDKNPEEERAKLLKAKRGFLLKLGKLAFIHLLKNSLIFYAEDLQKCGLDPKEATVNSGFFNSVLREDQLFLRQKVFSFVHLTIQEFFAALYVYDCFTNNNDWTPELTSFLDLDKTEPSSRPSVFDLLKTTVSKVLEINSARLYFFQRFLLSLTVESNQRYMRGLLVPVKPDQDIVKRILRHLKAIQGGKLSPDDCINLFQTMVEMGDSRTSEAIQEYLKSKDRARITLTPLHCSALAFTIQVSKSVLKELELSSYNASEEGRRRLIPAVRSSNKANLCGLKMSEAFLKTLALSLSFPRSALRDLDLTDTDLQDSGVKLLCEGLGASVCKLRKLSLSGCLVTKGGCEDLASVLKTNLVHLEELDLSYNHVEASGQEALSRLITDPQYNRSQLQLNFYGDGIERMCPGLKKYSCDLSWDSKQAHTSVTLSPDHREASCSKEGPDVVLVCGGSGLSGRCYWEFGGSEPFNMGVMYQRKPEEPEFRLGQNPNSWSFVCSEEGCFAFHDNVKTTTQSVLCSRSSRLAVYFDHPRGVLSFFRVYSDGRARVCLHTFREKFTEDLFPAAELGPRASASFYQDPEKR